MRHVVTVSLIVTALVHLLPIRAVFGAGAVRELYGVAVDDAGTELLLRHRAVLFGLLAGFLVVAALRPSLHPAGLTAGLVSVLSFLVLSRAVDGVGEHLQRVVKVDIALVGLLVLGVVAHLAAA